ncbi:7TM diverse intracellular signaling domain-containing protein [Flammeovirga sp. OC4]|uniref:7TM diverse intracellular signaling domain-containing protein n=1 Tax=Flammeovirga sp. OC4 TaxID=1382345 RepID=UPI00155DB117|nr:7TM diverse intracellular signaling domain-containing protein [Flammeovirga sp. OC4]
MRITIKRHIVTFLCTLSILTTYATSNNATHLTVRLDDSLDEQILNLEKIPFWEDSSRLLTYEEMILKAPSFNTIERYSKESYNVNSAYWLKLYIDIEEHNSKSWTLELYDQSIDEIVFFLPQKSGEIRKEFMGDSYLFDQRIYFHKNFIIPLNNDIDYTKPIYINIKSNHKVDLHVNIRSTERLIKHATLEYLWFGIYYGAILIMSFYNFMLWLSIKESKYLIYILHILTVGVFNASTDGTGFQFIWSDNPSINNYVITLLSYAAALSLIFFIKEMMKQEAKTVKYFRYMNYLVGIVTSILIIDLFHFNSQFSDVMLIVTIVGLTVIVVKLRFENKKVSPFYIYGLAAILIGTVFQMLKIFGVIPLTPITQYTLRFSIFLEMLLFSYALYDSLRLIKEEQQRSKDEVIEHQKKTEAMQLKVIEEQEKTVSLKNKVNEELEEKVRERTISLMQSEEKLKEAYRKLEEKSERLNLINRTLDVNNSKLKEGIKKEREKRFIHKIISLEEFMELFPDQISCKRYLDKQKWEKGFTCKQCNNHKQCNDDNTSGSAQFSRRCSKCGYVESVTSNTVFHHVKFDLTKAFYLSYIFRYHENEFTNIELGIQLDMSRNTIAKFKTKVKSANENKLLLPTFELFEMA